MRRLVFSIIVASGLVMIGAGSASAEPAPTTVSAAKAVPGKKVCKVKDPKLNELSGLIATKTGYITINDSDSLARIFYLDADCAITKEAKFGGKGPYDTEDMALSPDGKTLWIGDIGDNDRVRKTIGLWKLPVNGSKSAVLYRLAYPVGDGPYDAEALMINGDGTPIIVTKQGATAGLYVPTGPLKANTTDGVPMRRAGEVKLPSTTTENPFGPIGRLTATGAAVSPDRTKVVIRTYADAFEWPVAGDDLLAALKGTPIATPLPNEPQGEAISYTADGKQFVTVSDMGRLPELDNYLLRYTPAVKVITAKTAAVGGGAAKGGAWYSNLSLDDITYLVGGIGLLGLLLVGAGVIGITRARRRAPLEPATARAGAGPTSYEPETELLTVAGATPGVYGGARSGPVYGGAANSAPQRGSGVYGGAPPNGRPGPAGQPAARPAPAARPVPAPVARPGPAARPGQGVQPGGQPGARPAQPAARPAQPGARPAQPGARPAQPGARPAQNPPPGVRPSAQPGGRPAQGPPPGRGGVYGAPPAPPPPAGRGGRESGPSQRPSGFFGQGTGHPDVDRAPNASVSSHTDRNDGSREYGNPGYDSGPYRR